jgi:hypothetical protein
LKYIHDYEGKLPKRLRLQLDNAGAENKNRFMLSFAALLAVLKVFEQVHPRHHRRCSACVA